MKQTEFMRIENEVMKTVEPILRAKVLEQVRRKEVRIVTLLCCVLGPQSM